MSQCLLLIFLIFSSFCFGQEVKYSIEIMPTAFGNRMNIPDEADTTILYGFNDVQIWAKPLRGWMKFRERFDNLEYPDEAKKLGI